MVIGLLKEMGMRRQAAIGVVILSGILMGAGLESGFETPAQMVMRSFINSLPDKRKPGEAQEEKWWTKRDAQANTKALCLTRAADDRVVGAVFLTGSHGGIFEFEGKLPGEHEGPVVLMTPVQEGEKNHDAGADAHDGTIRVHMLVITPGANGTPSRVTAILSNGTKEEWGINEPQKAELLVAPLREARKAREKVLVMAQELKAIEYPAAGLHTLNPQVGDETIVLVQGSRVGTVWGSGPYTHDSALPAAAVHAGVIANGEWALIRVKFTATQETFEGTEDNGVKTQPYGRWQMGYTVTRVKID